MLRKIRIILATIFFIGITMLFLDFTGIAHAWLGWMAKVQFLPALLSLNLGIVSVLVILTLLFGRVYCSVICPLGVMQDIISWLHGRTAKKNRFRFQYKKENNVLRYLFMAAFFMVVVFSGSIGIAAIFAPYSAYGRIASNLFAPIYQFGNNILAWISERAGSYAFYSVDIWIKSGVTFAIAAATFVLLGILAWKKGRKWCNLCPVGSLLGLIAKISFFAPVINSDKCRNCGLCGRQCKTSCINMKEHKIYYDRCVACMDCIETCKEGAIRYARRSSIGSNASKKNQSSPDQGRRAFMTSMVIAGAAATAKAQDIKVDGGLAEISRAQKPERKTPLVPAGSLSLKNFSSHCTACQLCVSVCPNGVLRPSTSLETLMQPEMSYERGYCRPECTKCSNVCPAGAIRPITKEEKSSIQIGHAVVILQNCVVNTDEVSCGNCARHCPAGAIRMVRKNPDDPKSLRIPTVNEERCIGCGACENLCPARPFTAIYVEGHEIHKTV